MVEYLQSQLLPYYTHKQARSCARIVVYFRLMFSNHFTFTKRQLGWLLLVGGIVVFAGIISIDLLDAGREGGIGPAQQLALAVSAGAALLGLTLIPLGDTPA